MIHKLAAIVGKNNVISGDGIGADFCRDEYPGGNYMPEAVVEAKSTEKVAEILQLCHKEGIPVTVRGAGTGQVGGSVPVKGGIVLSVKGMNRILEYNEDEHILRVQPGVLLQDVKAAADSYGMYYPPDPSEPTATIGGNMSTNAGGPCAGKYGRTKNYIADAVLVLADGTVTSLAGNEAVIGSEGTLAVITEISLKVIEKPGADAILLFPFTDMESAITAAKVIVGNGYEPSIVELMDTDIVEFSGNVTENPVFPIVMDGERVAATLMVTLEGTDDDDVMEKMEAVACLAEEGLIEPMDILVGDSASMKREFWAAHSAFHTSMESGAKSSRLINIDVPMETICMMIEFAKAKGEELGVQVLLHSHVMSGGMHIYVVSDELDKEEMTPIFDAFAEAVYARCMELGGDIVGEFGVGYAKVQYLSKEAKAAQVALKEAFDPKGILNPGKRG